MYVIIAAVFTGCCGNFHFICLLMAQKKLERFAELNTFTNVLQHPENMQGKWNDFFKNKNRIVLELACGKGEYALGLGRLFPEKNFIGVDIKGNRMWKGAKTALSEGLSNVAFLRVEIEKIENYFAKDEVSEIWITFPDPQLRLSKIRKRLTHPRFLRSYLQILQPKGTVNLKTDSPELYRFTKIVIDLFELDLLKDEDDIYSNQLLADELKIKTHYEKLDIAQSNRIHHLQFAINKEMPLEKDKILKELFREPTTN
jgi:tRNA (guanine-N7-)-methyltransferase